MKAKVVGMKDTDFTTDEGTRIRGLTLFITHKDQSVKGDMAGKIFLSENFTVPTGLAIGDEVDIEYNRFGKVAEMVRLTGQQQTVK